MIDYASEIKDRITMGDVLSLYGLTSKTSGRIPCPIHNGKDNNFSFKDRSFKCYVCGQSGTVLDFVMAYFGLPFTEAVKKLNDDFRLGLSIGSKPSKSEREEAKLKAARRRKQRLEKELEETILTARYNAWLDEYTRLDRIVQNSAPQGVFDEITDEYANALKSIENVKQRLGEAQTALYCFYHPESK